MEWLREWIWQIAGIIILSALCDMIVPGGEMKKYVKLVMGLILVVTVVKPLVKIPELSVAGIEKYETQKKAIELKNQLSEREVFNVIKIYKEKLAQKIKIELKLPHNITADVKVEVEEENNGKFGDITKVTVLVYSAETDERLINNIRKNIIEKFDIEAEKIRIVSLSENSRDSK